MRKLLFFVLTVVCSLTLFFVGGINSSAAIDDTSSDSKETAIKNAYDASINKGFFDISVSEYPSGTSGPFPVKYSVGLDGVLNLEFTDYGGFKINFNFVYPISNNNSWSNWMFTFVFSDILPETIKPMFNYSNGTSVIPPSAYYDIPTESTWVDNYEYPFFSDSVKFFNLYRSSVDGPGLVGISLIIPSYFFYSFDTLKIYPFVFNLLPDDYSNNYASWSPCLAYYVRSAYQTGYDDSSVVADEKYNQLQNQYNQLEGNYNNLQNQYNQLNGNYNTLQNQYNQLQVDYKKLQDNFNILSEYNLYGWGTYISQVEISSSGNVTNFTRAELLQKNWLTTTGTLNLFLMSEYNNTSYGQCTITLSFYNDGFTSTLLDIAPIGNVDLSVVVTDDDGNSKTIAFDNNNITINYESIYPDLTGSLIENIVFTGSSPDAFTSIYLKGNYSVYYDSGFNAGKNEGFTAGYNEGNTTGYDNGYKNGKLDGYSVGYNEGINDAGGAPFLTLFNAVLNAPINVFKQVFNFDLFGVNIYGLCTSLLTFALVIWLIKRFI